MLNSTLDTVRRMLGATCRGVPFAETLPAAAASNLIYRLRTWPTLPQSARTAENYRLLSVMSSRPVTRQWILERGSMDAHQLDALLRKLAAEGAVEVIDPAQFAGREPVRA